MRRPSMSNRRQLAVFAAVTALATPLLLLGYLWFKENYERIEEATHAGYQQEARRNPLLAAQLFLREMGIETESVTGFAALDALPPPSDLMVVRHLGREMSPEKVERLLAWLRAGGRLVTTVTETDDGQPARAHPFFAFLALQKRLQENVWGRVVADADLGGSRPRIEFASAYHLTENGGAFEAVLRVKSEHGTHGLGYRIGQGQVFVFSDLSFLLNPHLADYDHALFLWRLAAGNKGKTWLLYGMEFPSLFAILWEHAPEFCSAAMGFIVVFLWSLYIRMGPIEQTVTRQRRNILEFLDAGARYHMTLRGAPSLINATRKEVMRLLQRRHPQTTHLSSQEQRAWLARRTKLTLREIDNALDAEPATGKQFVEDSRALQRLGKRL